LARGECKGGECGGLLFGGFHCFSFLVVRITGLAQRPVRFRYDRKIGFPGG
jgi:hypothetical protein